MTDRLDTPNDERTDDRIDDRPDEWPPGEIGLTEHPSGEHESIEVDDSPSWCAAGVGTHHAAAAPSGPTGHGRPTESCATW